MGDRTAASYRELLRQGRWFAALPAAFGDALLEAAVVRRLAPGEILFSRGDPPTGLFAIVEGELRVGSVTETGKEALLLLLQPPTWFGEVSVLDGQPRTHDAVAESSAVFLQVPQAALDRIFAQDPGAWRWIGLLVASKLRLAFEQLEDLAILPLPLRLARRLVLMADSYGELKGLSRRRLEVSQDRLASMLSTSRQTVNQLLKELEAKRLVAVTRGAVEILDVDRLRALAELPSPG